MGKIGSNFNKILEERHIRKSDVSKGANVSKSCLSEWSKGSYRPRIDKIHRIAEYLNVSPAILIDDNLDIHEIPEPTSADDYVEVIDLYARLGDSDKYIIVEMMKNMCNRDLIMKKYAEGLILPNAE